jgi:hypothetical protein
MHDFIGDGNRAVLNAYNAVKPSRVRQVQLQKDLSASLSSFVDIIQVLLDEGMYYMIYYFAMM